MRLTPAKPAPCKITEGAMTGRSGSSHSIGWITSGAVTGLACPVRAEWYGPALHQPDTFDHLDG
jgi:hypothetical protein